MNRHPLLALLSAALVCTVAAAQQPPAEPKPDAKAMFDAAVARAKAKNRRALVVATDASPLTTQWQDARKKPLRRQLLYEFCVVEVDTSAIIALPEAARPAAAAGAGPSFVVLDGNSKPLGSWSSKDVLDRDGQLDVTALGGRLKALHAAPQDGKALLTTALAEAKTGNKSLLIHFDAPW